MNKSTIDNCKVCHLFLTFSGVGAKNLSPSYDKRRYTHGRKIFRPYSSLDCVTFVTFCNPD